MQEFDFFKPITLEELRQTLFENENSGVIAGGTDLLPLWNRHHQPSANKCWIDLTHINELRFIQEEDDQIHIGALSTHHDIAESALLKRFAPALVYAVTTIGCVQTRNRGTLGGNLANASPAADCAPPLLTHEACVNIMSQQGMHHVNLESFFISPRKSILVHGEIIHSVSFNKPAGVWGASYHKLGNRRGMAIAVASAASIVHLDQKGFVNKVRVAVGSLAPTPTRVKSAEEAVLGKNLQLENWHIEPDQLIKDIHPIDDVRATADYRLQAGAVLISRAVKEAYLSAQRRLS